MKFWAVRNAETREMEDVLAACLDEVRRPEDVEAALARHVAHAQELRPLLSATVSMRESMATPVREDRRLAARRRVLQAGRRPLPLPAANRASGQDTYRTPNVLLRPLWSSFAPAFVAALFFLIAFIPMLSLTSVSALPGDWNYGFKRATERVRLALALDPSERLNLQLAFHSRRLGEIERLAADGRLTDPALVQAFTDETSALVQTVSENPQIGPSEALKVAVQTQAQVQALSDKVAPLASASLKPVVDDAVQQSEQVQLKASEVAQSKEDAVAARSPSTQGTLSASATPTPKSQLDDSSTATATPTSTATPTATATATATALVPPSQPPLSVPAAPPRLNPAPAPVAALPSRSVAAAPLVPPAQPINSQQMFTKPLVPGENALTYIGPEMSVPQALASITGAYDKVYYTEPAEHGSAVFSYYPGQIDAPGMLEPGSQVTVSIKPGVPATLTYSILPTDSGH